MFEHVTVAVQEDVSLWVEGGVKLAASERPQHGVWVLLKGEGRGRVQNTSYVQRYHRRLLAPAAAHTG